MKKHLLALLVVVVCFALWRRESAGGDLPLPFVGVAVVYEAQQTPFEAQLVVNSLTWRQYLDERQVDWELLDVDDGLDDYDPQWQLALDRPRESLPWLVASGGQDGYDGPLPADLDQMQQLLAKLFP
jgi:hypothetical protein